MAFYPPGTVKPPEDDSVVERTCLQCGAAYVARRVLTSMDPRLVYCPRCGPAYAPSSTNPLAQVNMEDQDEEDT